MALPNTQVNVILKNVKETLYTTKITADKVGEWRVTLPMALQPTAHILTVTTKNAQNKNVTLSRNFTIAKSGEEVVLGATDEADLTPTVIASTPIPTQVVAEISPTVVIFSTVTPVPPTTAPVVSTTPPVSGDNNILVMIGSLSLVVIAAGVLLLM